MTPLHSAPPAVTVRVPAKVNLQLAVGPARPDGYHGVVTVYQALSLFDEVTVRPAERNKIVVTGEDADAVPTGPGQPGQPGGHRAGPGHRPPRARPERGADRDPQAHPDGRRAGRGQRGRGRDPGGLQRAVAHRPEPEATCARSAAGLGSDVPFALIGGTAVGRGRGEQLTAALVAGTYHWALAFAAGGLSTPEVYATCDRLRAAGPPVAVTARSAPGPSTRS